MQAKPIETWYRILDNGCWYWAGQNRGGYGLYWFQGKQYQAHRFMYEKHKKLIAPNMHLDHLCRNRQCVNPDHMEEVSNKDNVRRGKRCNITLKDANEIRDLLKAKIYSQTEVGVLYGISQPTVSELVRNEIWI